MLDFFLAFTFEPQSFKMSPTGPKATVKIKDKKLTKIGNLNFILLG